MSLFLLLFPVKLAGGLLGARPYGHCWCRTQVSRRFAVLPAVAGLN